MQSTPFGKLPGEKFGERYQIERQLSKRAGRYTLLARDMLTNSQVVIKRLSFGEDFVWDDLKLFEREAATLKNLSHPAIPKYLDSFDLDLPSGKGFALVQTYIPAKSLEEHIQAGRSFSEAEILELAETLLKILQYLHERAPSVIHRDIKPSNILLSDRSGNSVGTVYLVDFGSVQTLAAQAGSSITVVGTYGYMPPEQFGNRASPASDLYALGATLIYLATGKHPADLSQIDQQLQFEDLAHLSFGLEQWLKKMVQPSLDKRFTSAQAALTALEQRHQASEALVVQPSHSKIILTKKIESLDILFPPATSSLAGFLSLIPIAGFAIAWNSFIITWTGFAFQIPFPINIAFLLFSVPFWAVGLAMVAGIIFGIWGRVRLRVTEQQICQYYELFGFKRSATKASSRQNIDKLELTTAFYKREADGNRVAVRPKLSIWAGTLQYGCFGGEHITKPELEWLAQELSHWLSLPIHREE
jgi:serine/threonine protein kinase